MTYCIGLKLEEGLVLMSDTRTNAGLDNVSRFTKMSTWEVGGERAVALLTAGNLSITQGVITRLKHAITDAEEGRTNDDGSEIETLLNAPSMFRVAQIVGETMRDVQERHRKTLEEQGAAADATVLVAGQRNGGQHRLFLIYSAGNFIEASYDTPFFQLGEHKYGKPILDRIITPETPISVALKAAFVSMDSTIRSNLTVGLPLDLAIIRTGQFKIDLKRRIEQEDPDFQRISNEWSDALRNAFESLPEVTTDGASRG
ncbi:MAG: peptidase [Pseudomonadota bacterium]